MKARLKYSSLQRIAPREWINFQTDLKYSYNSLDSHIPTRAHFSANLQNAKKFYSRLKTAYQPNPPCVTQEQNNKHILIVCRVLTGGRTAQ